MRKRGEKATAVEKLRVGMKSASAKSLVNGRSKVRVASDVSLSTTPIYGTQASEQSKRINRVQLMNGVGVRAKLNPVVYRQVRCHADLKKKTQISTAFRTETGCSSRVLNVGKVFPCCYEVAAAVTDRGERAAVKEGTK
jgi:hypothetical protein